MNSELICVEDSTTVTDTSRSNPSSSSSRNSVLMQNLSLLERLRLVSQLQSQRATPSAPPSSTRIIPSHTLSTIVDSLVNENADEEEEEELQLDELSRMNFILNRSPVSLSSTEIPQVEARVYTFTKAILQLANRRRNQQRNLETEHLFYISTLQQIAKDYRFEVLSELVQQLGSFVATEEQTPSQIIESIRLNLQQDSSLSMLDKKYLNQAFTFVCQTALRCILLTTDRNQMERETITLLASVGETISQKKHSSPLWNVLQYFHSRIYQIALDNSIHSSATQ